MSERISDPTHTLAHTQTHANDLLMLPTLEAHLSRRRWRPTTQTLDPAALVVLHKNNNNYKYKYKNKIKIPKKYPKEILGKLSKLQALHVQQQQQQHQHQQQQQKVEFCCNALATPRRA